MAACRWFALVSMLGFVSSTKPRICGDNDRSGKEVAFAKLSLLLFKSSQVFIGLHSSLSYY